MRDVGVQWEYFETNNPTGITSNGVRRLRVKDGWIYQISYDTGTSTNNWNTPVFVPEGQPWHSNQASAVKSSIASRLFTRCRSSLRSSLVYLTSIV